MTVCLQGGGEFSAGCRAMDADLAKRAGGRVVVTALAGAVGSDYDTATANGVRHFRAVGGRDVVGAPDVRIDPEGAAEAVRSARLLVLPGGSPSRLLEALTSTSIGDLVGDLLADGGLVMGASAGAMVLCPWTVLPDRRTAGTVAVERGLGLVPDVLVLPHWSGGSSRGDWLRAIDAAVPNGAQVLGIPEESGVLVDDEVLTAVGTAPTRLVTSGRDLAVGESWRLP
ncbi:MAG: Type 1 glutamine amidotransferase-like domain-containing protein [Actinobacteria bacterium]|nr:Type 1 glutamine amidotransferase-like domain-containing protein [Actinomycetota bacterium]MCA1720172.1 Type 1 glutamine amidotransferase-like domain-containing protein [Actinomycetota bacterium]